MARWAAGSYIAVAMHALPLHFLHVARSASFEALGGREVVASVGPVEDGWKAAREGAVLYDHSARELVSVTGDDRVSFVHGMCTQDVNGLPTPGAGHAAMLTAKGAMVADARVVKLAEVLLIDVEPGLGEKVRAFLDTYLISEDAELEDASGRYGQLGLYGPKAAEVFERALGTAPTEGLLTRRDAVQILTVGEHQVLAFGSPGYTGQGVELWSPLAALEPLFLKLEAAGGRLIGRDVLEVLRVEGGLPRYGADLTDTTIPLEAHLEASISYNKGCYIGQEVIARATFRGQMSRKLVGLLLGENAPAPGTELFNGEKRVGWITSVVRSPARGEHVALGYVHRTLLTEGTQLSLANGAGEATVAPLPLVTP